MTKEQIEKVKELDHNIGMATEEVQGMKGVPFDTGYCTIGHCRICADERLLSQIIRLAANYKQEQIKNWQKELDEL
ncbi:MAG: hypothetical protein IJV24_07240 [Prevotella sp.]|nr:hypothetical protein [Prevotella sp.]